MRKGTIAAFLPGFVLALLLPFAVSSMPPSQSEVDGAVARVAISSPAVEITGTPRRARSPAAAKPFTRRQAYEVGVDHFNPLNPDEFMEPFWNGRGLSAGDVDQDGYQDILVATSKGVRLYINDGGALFIEKKLEIPEIADLSVHSAAIVDVNNDGWPDLFFTSFAKGNYFIVSNEGRFERAGLVKVASQPRVLTKSLAFGDIDEDGDLDVVEGNWFYGFLRAETPSEHATNKLLFYEDGNYRTRVLEEVVGETLSVLFSDWNLDGHLDLIVGNDFGPPDYYYFGDGKGGFRMIHPEDGIIPVSGFTTMSIDTGDMNNDLLPDIFVAQIAAGATGKPAHIRQRFWTRYCEEIERPDDAAKCQENIDIRLLFNFGSLHQPGHLKRCREISDCEKKLQCAGAMTLLTIWQLKEDELCDRMPRGQDRTEFICRNYFLPSQVGRPEEYALTFDWIMNENILLVATEDGRFENRAVEMGVDVSDWSWNARFVDLDNDEWQDLYVVNGTWARANGASEKFFFRNIGGKHFENLTDEFGLQNYMINSAYVTVDYDNDGDLDLFVSTTNGPLWFYRNNDAGGNSILFELRDHRANRFCVGCKVTIHYGSKSADGQRAQIRELKSGGGFLSFDAPILHFGLGGHGEIDRVEVEWSTGGRTILSGKLPANTLYRITRPKPAEAASQAAM